MAELQLMSRQVERTGRELSETVQALAERASAAADLKGQLQRQAAHLADGARHAAAQTARQALAPTEHIWKGSGDGARRPGYIRATVTVAPVTVLAALVVLRQVRRQAQRPTRRSPARKIQHAKSSRARWFEANGPG